ncbi:hypothetical protein EDB19DRAFT_1831194 [Suillus lakei]|nr:hypothetical protein EDB19DRAFT_1831194 [Suillus lakei]
MSAWKNEQGEVLFGMHNDNKALGDGDSFMKMKDWEDIEPVWQEYAQEQFEGDWMPLLPDITEPKLEVKKAIVRAFLTSHYRICSWIDKAVVPWSAILQSQDDFVARKYLPADVDLKEPSKLQNWDMTALLNFWYARQETGEGPTFLFKAWKNRDGDMVASGVSSRSPSHQTQKVQKQIIQKPQESSTEAEGDPKSDTHHTEDNAGDDTANAREVTAVPCSIPKPCPVKPAKTDAQQTSQMGDLLVGLTDAVTRDSPEDVAMEGGNMLLAPKNMQGKKVVIEPLARTTQNGMFDTWDISSDGVPITDGALSFMMEATFQAD